MQRSAKRPYQISLRLSEEEADMFEKVARHFNLPVSGMLRMVVAQARGAIAEFEKTAVVGRRGPQS